MESDSDLSICRSRHKNLQVMRARITSPRVRQMFLPALHCMLLYEMRHHQNHKETLNSCLCAFQLTCFLHCKPLVFIMFWKVMSHKQDRSFIKGGRWFICNPIYSSIPCKAPSALNSSLWENSNLAYEQQTDFLILLSMRHFILV